jgi:hypothetical protein
MRMDMKATTISSALSTLPLCLRFRSPSKRLMLVTAR